MKKVFLSLLSVVLLPFSLPSHAYEDMDILEPLVTQATRAIYDTAETTGDIQAMEKAEREAAESIRQAIKNGHQPTVDHLAQAAFFGYPLITEALLTDPKVRQYINTPNHTSIQGTPWAFAVLSMRHNFAACNPKFNLQDPFMWVPKVITWPYHTQARYQQVVALLEASGAKPDEPEARQLWRAMCPASTQEANRLISTKNFQSALQKHGQATLAHVFAHPPKK